ncbi:MAG: hypothetical protein LBN95_08005 [Prevotellaceae bacterium]|jgi:hypothetical protein|nr:hypothetical protein [Prevotellaceae bacterium]
MKKIFLLIAVIFIAVSCNSPQKSTTETDETQQQIEVVPNQVVINGDTAKNFYSNGTYRRILTSKIIKDTIILQKIIDTLQVKENIIYFNISGLTANDEEYAYSMGKVIVVYKNPPKTKGEAIFNRKSETIKVELDNINLTLKKGIDSDNLNTTINEITQVCSDFRELVNGTEDEPKLKSKVQSIKSLISSMQVKAFPMLRKAWAINVKNTLWQHDIDVKYSNTSITLIGGVFAANQNKQDTYESLSPKLHELRFTRINFKWYKYDDEYTYYTLETLSDSYVDY